MACCEVEHREKQNSITTTTLWVEQLNHIFKLRAPKIHSELYKYMYCLPNDRLPWKQIQHVQNICNFIKNLRWRNSWKKLFKEKLTCPQNKIYYRTFLLYIYESNFVRGWYLWTLATSQYKNNFQYLSFHMVDKSSSNVRRTWLRWIVYKLTTTM